MTTTPQRTEEIAKEIRVLSESIRRFRDGPLTDHCIVVLLQDVTKIPRKQIKMVLEGMSNLDEYFLKDEEQ